MLTYLSVINIEMSIKEANNECERSELKMLFGQVSISIKP